jgi:hypothetical protein
LFIYHIYLATVFGFVTSRHLGGETIIIIIIIITPPKVGKNPKVPQNIHPIRFFFTTDKLSEELVLRTIQRHTEE